MSAAVPVSGPPTAADLAATETFDFEDPAVQAFVASACEGAEDEVARARQLFATVRDRLRYDPYRVRREDAAFAASEALRSTSSYCVPKAVLLVAGARAVGIPARIGFADVRNHLSSPRLLAVMGSDLFVFHGYAALFVGGAWRKASPAFNAGLCERFGVAPLEFDGRSDALMHAFDGAGRRHMEYETDHGTFSDMPFERFWGALEDHYGVEAIRRMTGRDTGEDPAFALA